MGDQNRDSWEKYFLKVADVIKERSTCTRLSVGSVAVKGNKIISTGYNGSPTGEDHCIDVGCMIKKGHCIRTIHAELNAIMNGMETGVNLKGSTLYVTHFPCFNCAKHIVQVGIKRVVYKNDYKNSREAEDLFKRSGLKVEQMNNELEYVR